MHCFLKMDFYEKHFKDTPTFNIYFQILKSYLRNKHIQYIKLHPRFL